MKLLICLVALSVYSVSATPTPQFFGSFQPLTPFGNWLQNSFQNIPRPPFWNPFRPQTQVQVTPPTSSLQQVASAQQVTPAQTNSQWPQIATVPDRQISNNEWYWQNWIPLPIIPQFAQEQSPTIIIISRPAKQPSTEGSNSNAAASSEATATANSNSNQSMNISVVVPNSNEPSINSPVPVLGSNEASQNISSATTTAPLSASSVAQSSAAAESSSNLGLNSGEKIQ